LANSKLEIFCKRYGSLLNHDESCEGPYVIASVPSAGRCTLSLGNGKVVKNGEEIDVDYMEAACEFCRVLYTCYWIMTGLVVVVSCCGKALKFNAMDFSLFTVSFSAVLQIST
jgi:hypothetical protein